MRHLTLSERRLREAECRVAIEAAEGARREVELRQALETAAPQVVEYEVGQAVAAGGVVGDRKYRGQAAAETSVTRRTRMGRRSSSSGGEEERYLTTSWPPTPGAVDENDSDTARPIAGDENRIEGRVLRGINNRVPSTNTSHRVGWVDANQQERGKVTHPEQNLGTIGRAGDMLGMAASDKEDAVGSPRDVDAGRWQANDSEQENIALSEDTNKVKFETDVLASVAEIDEGMTVVESARLVQELRSTEEEVMACLI